jgi:hypothetical protein
MRQRGLQRLGRAAARALSAAAAISAVAGRLGGVSQHAVHWRDPARRAPSASVSGATAWSRTVDGAPRAARRLDRAALARGAPVDQAEHGAGAARLARAWTAADAEPLSSRRPSRAPARRLQMRGSAHRSAPASWIAEVSG